MLAHIRDGKIIRRYPAATGWVDLADGRRVSPPVAGFTDGSDKVVPLVSETIDNSTRAETVTTRETVVEKDRVVDRIIIEDVPRDRLLAAINAERARRIMAGTDITLSDGTVIGMQGRPEDQINLTTQKDIAQHMIANGQPDATVIWRDSHNTLHKLKPAQMIEVWLKSTAHVSAIYQASWALKAMDPIPDVSDNTHWPK